MSYEPLLKRIAELEATANQVVDTAASEGQQITQYTDRFKARAALAAPAHEYAACVEALVGRLPINGRGECFMCSLGNEPDEEMRHYDHINNEDESYCLQSEIYDDARDALDALAKVML